MENVRYELYPSNNPICYCVGFKESQDGEEFYIDTRIALEEAEGKTEDEVIELAYDRLREQIENKKLVMQGLPIPEEEEEGQP